MIACPDIEPERSITSIMFNGCTCCGSQICGGSGSSTMGAKCSASPSTMTPAWLYTVCVALTPLIFSTPTVALLVAVTS